MPSKELDFLVSALTTHNPHMSTKGFLDWFAGRREAHRFHIERIPFSGLEGWHFEHATGNLAHDTGGFFTIEGIWVESNFGPVAQWSQPIINQPEVGILGILAKNFDGVLHFLMQAKMEPGNINMVQLAPTLQATRSNYTRLHRGKAPPYLDYFLDRGRTRILVDTLHSEQGARFLRKRNRNIIVETKEDVPLLDDYCWLTLGQLQRLLRHDNVVNMDARTVLSCIPFSGVETQGVGCADIRDALRGIAPVDADWLALDMDPFTLGMLSSTLDTGHSLHSTDEVISWFTELKVRYVLDVEPIPLKFVKGWHVTEDEIRHGKGTYFRVIAVKVEAENREVPCWSQPLVQPCEDGIVAYLVKKINGVPHLLVQGKVEPGNFDVVEMAPSVQCITGSYKDMEDDYRPPFLDEVLAMPGERIRASSMQSEEGGRFYHEENRNLIIEVDDAFPEQVPDNYIWMTMHQLKEFIKFNNYLNVEARCLLPGFTAECP